MQKVPAGSLQGSARPPLFTSRIPFFHLAEHRGQGPTSHFLAIIGNYKARKQSPSSVSPLSSSCPSHHLFSKSSSLFVHSEETQPVEDTSLGVLCCKSGGTEGVHSPGFGHGAVGIRIRDLDAASPSLAADPIPSLLRVTSAQPLGQNE